MMKRFFFTFLLTILFQTSRAQENNITAFDLYGCWIKERLTHNKDSIINKPITGLETFRKCGYHGSKNYWYDFRFELQAFGQCVFTEVPIHIDLIQEIKGKWKFDKKNQIVELFYPENYFDRRPYNELPADVLNKLKVRIRFRLMKLDDDKMVFEELDKQ